MVNPYADTKKQARSTAESAAIDFCEVVEARANTGHTARVSVKGDRGSSRVVSAIVPSRGDVNVPEVGDIVAVAYAKGNKPIVLGTIYTENEDVPEYEVGERVIGHPGSDASIRFNKDGSIDIDGDGGAAIRVNGSNVGGGYTDEQARDAIGTALTAGTGINITVDDPNDTITIDSTVSTYTDSDAIDAINNDADHGSTAQHDYYTDSDAVTAINAESSLNVDITGDADTVDGQHASDFADSSHTHTQSDVTNFSSAAENIYVQDTEPSSPQENDIWIDTS